ncbi:sensor histidine kinase [Nonomuraea sp. NPDC049480]|uniref:sensor histidine kinase n=1 Tax=Nonomuraea sp. NPDC049480 TaxID=3364353 RepID=UPI00379E6916
MIRIRHVVEPFAGLLLNAVTGVAAWGLLLLLGGCAVLVPVGGRRLRPRVLAVIRALAGFQLDWAARVLGREVTGAPERVGHGMGRGRHRADGNGRAVAWLAAQAVVGPACLISLGLAPAAIGMIWRLRLMENSRPRTLALSLAIVAIAALTLWAIPRLRTLQARLAEQFLRPPDTWEDRVRALTESRAAVVSAQAAEVRRIERDLHDGAQARLVAVRMSLGMAKSAGEPERVRELVQEAWEAAGQALVDLRDLVNGIHPPVLADRGLAGAIQSVALLCPIPVEVDIDLPGRPEPPVESALYFATAEALTNVAKHSAATRAWVRLRQSAGVLRLMVGDDGRGGAYSAAGSGLDGIRRRLSAFDGTLGVHSPPGGPTELTMEIPCALSSPKTSPS